MVSFIRLEVDGLGVAFIDPQRIMAVTANPADPSRSVIVYDNASESPELLPIDSEPDELMQEIERVVPGAKSFHLRGFP